MFLCMTYIRQLFTERGILTFVESCWAVCNSRRNVTRVLTAAVGIMYHTERMPDFLPEAGEVNVSGRVCSFKVFDKEQGGLGSDKRRGFCLQYDPEFNNSLSGSFKVDPFKDRSGP